MVPGMSGSADDQSLGQQTLSPFLTTELQAPPSPRTHRSLRRLQSAHDLGAKSLFFSHQQSREQLREPRQQDSREPTSYQAASPDSPNPEFPKTLEIQRDTTSIGGLGQRQRGRANSDAAMVNLTKMPGTATTTPRRMSARKPVFSHGHLSLSQLIRDGPSDEDFAGALETARWKVVDEGIKSELDGMSTTRIYVWLILLDAPIMGTDDYLALIHRGPSPDYSKIRNDTFRTLTTDPLFRRRVSEASLIRLLNAVAWRLHDAREEVRRGRDRPTSSDSGLTRTDSSQGDDAESTSSRFESSSPAAKNRARALTLTTEGSDSDVAPESGTYVQGMNVLAAPFLYAARSEAEAFVAFHSLLTRECPGYIRGAMDGVHKGLKLVDKVLNIVDPKLSKHLRMKGMSAEIYAFPSVLTLSACTPPLPEVLRLWDFLFAYGPHLNIICIVAQLWRIRDEILRTPSPNRLLRSFPVLQADVIKSMTIAIIQKIPDDVYAEIATHAQ